jgi:hypothetical protein
MPPALHLGHADIQHKFITFVTINVIHSLWGIHVLYDFILHNSGCCLKAERRQMSLNGVVRGRHASFTSQYATISAHYSATNGRYRTFCMAQCTILLPSQLFALDSAALPGNQYHSHLTPRSAKPDVNGVTIHAFPAPDFR